MKSLFVILIAVTLAAQAQEPAAVPVDQEPNHKVVFKNDYVRVIDATFPAGHVTLNHSHALDNVAVTISTGRGTAPGTGGILKGWLRASGHQFRDGVSCASSTSRF